MDDLNYFRNQIDSLDEEIMKLIERRFDVTKKVGIFKKKNGIKVIDSSREDKILKKCESLNYSDEIVEIYKKIFDLSKKNQRG